MPPIGFLICTTCFWPTSAGTGMQRCRCEKYQPYPGVDCPNGYHLCQLCAALLDDWGLLQAKVLFESVPAWKREPFILLDTWETKFALGAVKATSRSVAAFKGYLRVESFGEISDGGSPGQLKIGPR
jgi:hypothetical protein